MTYVMKILLLFLTDLFLTLFQFKDLHGAWESFTVNFQVFFLLLVDLNIFFLSEKGHNAPLYARTNEYGEQRLLNVDWAARYWIEKGAPKSKIILGLGTYARCFTLSSSNNNLGAPAWGGCHAGTVNKKGCLNIFVA
jgi:chitinase